MSTPDLLTLDVVADRMGMSPRWVRARIAEGAQHTRLGNRIRFTEDQYAALVADHTRAEKSA